MRTPIIILGGLVLWGACISVARLLNRSTKTAAVAFVAIWFLVAAANLWIGISQAGYTFGEELPIFLVIFLVPASVAILVKWKML